MKIVHVDSGRSWRGGQQQIALLIRRLAGFGATSVLAAPDGPLSERLASEIAIQRWESRGDLDVAALVRLRAILRRERPDVVHLHSGRAHALGVPAARWAGVRHVVASRRVAGPPGRDPASRLKYRLPVDRWLCVSAAVRDTLREAGVADARLSVVPSGVDVAALRASAAAHPGEGTALRAQLGIEPDAPLLFTVASLTEEKGHAALLEVADALRDTAPRARLVWVGDGPERAALLSARAARGLDGRIHLLGRRDEVAPLVSAATLLLVPSWNEGFCTAALEAQALGVPVVGMRVGGLPEAVADGVSGVLVQPRSAPAMAAAVLDLLTDSPRRARMGEAGRSHAETFDASRTAARTWAIYQEVVRSSRPSQPE